MRMAYVHITFYSIACFPYMHISLIHNHIEYNGYI